MTTTTISPLDVACPICAAPPTAPCWTLAGRQLTGGPHLYRVAVAEEESQR